MSNSDDVVIRPGTPTGTPSSNDRVKIGAGGSGIGLRRGGHSGITNKQAKRLLKRQKAAREKQAREAKANADANARREHANAVHRQTIEGFTRSYPARKAELDNIYSAKAAVLSRQVESDINAEKRAPKPPGKERWQLYLISKEKSEIEGLIAKK
jgi:hypothetical protein